MIILQTQQLVQMICYPVESRSQLDCGELNNRDIINRILKTLDQWTLRVSLMELNLMFKQATTNSVSKQATTNSVSLMLFIVLTLKPWKCKSLVMQMKIWMFFVLLLLFYRE